MRSCLQNCTSCPVNTLRGNWADLGVRYSAELGTLSQSSSQKSAACLTPALTLLSFVLHAVNDGNELNYPCFHPYPMPPLVNVAERTTQWTGLQVLQHAIHSDYPSIQPYWLCPSSVGTACQLLTKVAESGILSPLVVVFSL